MRRLHNLLDFCAGVVRAFGNGEISYMRHICRGQRVFVHCRSGSQYGDSRPAGRIISNAAMSGQMVGLPDNEKHRIQQWPGCLISDAIAELLGAAGCVNENQGSRYWPQLSAQRRISSRDVGRGWVRNGESSHSYWRRSAGLEDFWPAGRTRHDWAAWKAAA